MAFAELIVQLKDLVSRFGLSYVFGRYYSLYRAEVKDNQDPESRGRIRALCPAVSRTEVLDWAIPVSLMAGKSRGLFFPPDVGDFVYLMFEEGNAAAPIYVGGWWAKGELGSDFQASPPTVRGIQTPSGHVIEFDDTSGSERLIVRHRGGSTMTFGSDSSISIETSGGHSAKFDDPTRIVQLKDANGNSIVLTPTGITFADVKGNQMTMLGGGVSMSTSAKTDQKSGESHSINSPIVNIGDKAGSPAVHGDKLMAYLRMLVAWMVSHQHVQIGFTTPPTSPPPQPPEDIVSETVKINTT